MANDFLQWLIHLTLLSSVICVAIFLLRWPARQLFGAGIAYQMWGIFPLILLAQLVPNKAVVENIPVVTQALSQFIQTTTSTNQVAETQLPFWITLAWMAGCVITAGWFWRQHRHFIHALGSIMPLDGIFHAENVNIGPALVGVWSAKIIVPADFSLKYTQEEKELIITHEKYHLARGDTYSNILCAFIQCLFWFNPLIHIAANRFRADQELACDAAVIAQHPTRRRAYAEAILKTQISLPQTVIGCHLQSHQPLKERIMQLQRISPNKTQKSIGTVILGALLGLSTYAAWAVSPASVQDTVSRSGTVQASLPQSGKTKFQVKASIEVDGVKISPRTISNEGESAEILVDGKSAKWGISYTLNNAKTKNGLDAIMLDVSIKKNGEFIARPKILTGLNMPAVIQQKNSEKNDFELTLEPSIIN
jgi:bla regulator protein BlaR1